MQLYTYKIKYPNYFKYLDNFMCTLCPSSVNLFKALSVTVCKNNNAISVLILKMCIKKNFFLLHNAEKKNIFFFHPEILIWFMLHFSLSNNLCMFAEFYYLMVTVIFFR